jgi:hypothetical protein
MAHLSLRVNRGTQIEMLAGNPLRIEVILSGSRTGRPIAVGDRWEPWHRLIRLEFADGRAMEWATNGTIPQTVAFGRATDGAPEITETAGDTARVEGGRFVHMVTTTVAPEATTEIADGTYKLRAVLKTPRWMFWKSSVDLSSNMVAIVIHRPEAPGPNGARLAAELLARRADYNLGRKRFEEARADAARLVSLQPQDPYGYVELGDALAGLGQPHASLAAYRQSRRLLPPSYDEPVWLLDRIQRVVREISTRSTGK